ncbi:MAG: competence/damage-inducible protein A [Sphingobacteriales bacterium]|nr:MAG: competence/damage-inducible protein A [Sphingobacteriales bacterium]
MRCTIITIGDEILIGQTIDTNSAWIATELNKIGVNIYEILSVADNAEHIKNALDRAIISSDIILTTGGLGPTKDDITKNTLAEYFSVPMVFNQEIWDSIEAYMIKRGRPVLDSLKTMAELPENCEVLKNERGTAAAMWFNERGRIIVSMPGVPHEMKDFVSRVIIPRLEERYQLPALVHKTIMCAGLGESIIAEKIKDIESNLPDHIKLAYLPSYGIVRLRLSGSGTIQQDLEKEVLGWRQKIDDILQPKYAYGYDEMELSEAIGILLTSKGATVSTAESCTGGLIAHKFTEIAGCSRYFKGGVVAYSNELKESLLGVNPETLQKYGAVSEETVREMADGALKRLKTDYAIAVSGIAGPDGGSNVNPVGTVWIAVINSKKEITASRFSFSPHRHINIELSANYALNLLRRKILEV